MLQVGLGEPIDGNKFLES